MQRREVLKYALASCTFAGLPNYVAQAYQFCQPAANPVGALCEVGVDPSRLPVTYAWQQMNQWCWAASISMIFRYHGYDVSQQQIVIAVYGGLVNLPAMNGLTISSQLNRKWIDSTGKQFRCHIEGLYDFDAGVGALTNSDIVSALGQDTPLLMGNSSHAMLLISAAYLPVQSNPQIFNIGLMDPYPGIGLRGPNSPAEMIPMSMGGNLRYLALPRVSAA